MVPSLNPRSGGRITSGRSRVNYKVTSSPRHARMGRAPRTEMVRRLLRWKVLSRGAAAECSPGREPGDGETNDYSPEGAEKTSSAPPGLVPPLRTGSQGLRPGL